MRDDLYLLLVLGYPLLVLACVAGTAVSRACRTRDPRCSSCLPLPPREDDDERIARLEGELAALRADRLGRSTAA